MIYTCIIISKTLQPEIINEFGEANEGEIEINGYTVDLVNLLEIINKRIEILLDRDHFIGHSYFLCVKNENGLKEMKTILYNNNSRSATKQNKKQFFVKPTQCIHG